MAAFYIGAGINHFLHPAFYEQMIPPYMPSPAVLVCISGICELLLGVLLFPAATRVFAAWLIIHMLIVFFPIHTFMIKSYYEQHDPKLWIAVVRLPLQFILIWWAWLYTKKFR
ncbi:MAG: hypothetical protein JWQ38_329 [Flavipsychrobacter sp.]|nr:hypothetical protein [Flavipsychrobacter sp.]